MTLSNQFKILIDTNKLVVYWISDGVENNRIKEKVYEGRLEKNNLTQLHIAETEKFAHVTKYFNGGKQRMFS